MIIFLSTLCLICTMLPMAVFAQEDGDDQAPEEAVVETAADTRDSVGYGGETLPEGPDMSGNVITVTPENAQYTLDGAYGVIDGKTIHFSSGNYTDVLVLARATKFSRSNTTYYNGNWNVDHWEKADEVSTPDELTENIRYYTRRMQDVTFTADEGVELPGFVMESGHIYGSGGNDYDCVKDVAVTSSNDSYYVTCDVRNIAFSGLTIRGTAQFRSSLADTVIQDIAFADCTFSGDSSNMAGNAYQAVKIFSGGNGLSVTNCYFENYFQGIYVMETDRVTVTDSRFYNTTHNAIALQSSASTTTGSATIQNNYFEKIGDRIIRFGNIAENAEIQIVGNEAVNSGDSDGEVIKADSIPTSAKILTHVNNWGENTKVSNPQMNDNTDHEIVKTEAKEATCVEDGNSEYYTCTFCGKYYSDADGKNEIAEDSWVIAKTGEHTFGEWKTVTEAAIGQKGSKERVCGVCGYKETAEIPALAPPEEEDPPKEEPEDTKKEPVKEVPKVTPDVSQEKASKVPKTGDEMNGLLSAVLLLACGASCVGTATWYKRQNR